MQLIVVIGRFRRQQTLKLATTVVLGARKCEAKIEKSQYFATPDGTECQIDKSSFRIQVVFARVLESICSWCKCVHDTQLQSRTGSVTDVRTVAEDRLGGCPHSGRQALQGCHSVQYSALLKSSFLVG